MFKASFFTGLFISLWSILFVIPGIIKCYSYAMTSYVIADDPDTGALDAISESRAMMDGHKLDLFVLELSFIPWILFGIVTFGIGFIYVVPYMTTAKANFYNEIKPRPIYKSDLYPDEVEASEN